MIVELIGPGEAVVLRDMSGIVPPPTTVATVASMAALRALLPTSAQAVGVELLAFYANLDGGGGSFFWSASTPIAAHDGGTIVAPSAATIGCWIRSESRYTRTWLATWFGMHPSASRSANAAAMNALYVALGPLLTVTPDGTYLGGGVARIPAGYYRCTGVVNATPIVAPQTNISSHVSTFGDGQLGTSLDFDDGGILATDYPGGNLSTQVHFRDLGLYCTSPSNTHAGLFYQGAADCTIERMRIAGFATAIDTLDCNTITMRDIIFAGCATGVANANAIGVGLRGNANQMRVRDCQFNGPGINILHGDGVGHFISGNNSEGGVLGLIRGGHIIVHEGWTTEGQDATETPYLFRFDSQGSLSNQLVAVQVAIRDNFLGGSDTRDLVLFDETATMYDFAWERNYVAHAPSSGVVTLPHANHIGHSCYSSGTGLPTGVPLFSHTPAQYVNLTP